MIIVEIRKRSKLIKLIISIAFLIILLHLINIERAIQTLKTTKIQYVFLASITVLLNIILISYRDLLVFNKFGDFRFNDLIVGGTIVRFINIVTPSSATGRAASPLVYSSLNKSNVLKQAVGAVLATTSFYSISYGLMTFLGTLYLYQQIPNKKFSMLFFGTGSIYLFIGIFLLLPFSERSFPKPRFSYNLIGRFVDRLQAFFGLKSFSIASPSERGLSLEDFGMYSLMTFISLILLQGLRYILIFRALGTPIQDFGIVFWIPIIAYSISILPITLGGIGLAELTSSSIFIAIGLPETIVVVAVFIDRILNAYLPAGIGALLSHRIKLEYLN